MAQALPQMNVPLFDLRQQHEPLMAELRAAVGRVLDTQQFVLGPEVAALETELAAYCQVKHAVGCSSGSDALLLALMALDVRAGDEVITTPHTFFATGGAVARLGARPVFVDVDPRTYNIRPDLVAAAITGRTRAVIPVHLYGQCAEMDAINESAARHNIPVIEDAAQAVGAEDAGRRAGSMSRIGCFSFYPSKNLGAAGEAGLVTTNDDALAERLRALRVHGGLTEYLHREVGVNSRLDAMQAAVLRVKLPHLEAWTQARRERAETYGLLLTNARLPFPVTRPYLRDDARHVFHLYVVRVPAEVRDPLLAHLRAHGVGTKVYYPVPLHLQECFAYLGYKPGDLPEAERAARETLALPLYPELTLEQQQYVVDVLGRFQP
ncbi:MAG TPA: DegT/DnrJ/EryC1/StrS family aminotransferase [Pyrinomonadaceae bacterium]|jgi:dTDP-4-amino-4,6-dideoxygalactose transaminase